MPAIANPFEKYYRNKEKNKYASRSPVLLCDYITLITGMFEQICIELNEKMISFARSKYTKRRHAVYSRLNELEDLRKTMIRAQQIHQSQINKLQKENYKIRSEMKADVVETPENKNRRIVIDRNMRAIAFAKRCSKEITRTIAKKNIDPTKEKLEVALEKFVRFSEMFKEKDADTETDHFTC
jgi:hypothetical protein